MSRLFQMHFETALFFYNYLVKKGKDDTFISVIGVFVF